MHFTKLAVVYVRQSSAQQVLGNRESTARQYALGDLAQNLGWPRERVLVIDEDQGQSGASSAHRLGFQRLLAEVTLDHVGLVLGLEMSRLARSSKDWHHLLEVCAVFGTLLGDQDGIYDPTDPNDRLLLGLKGTMSEVELHTMRNRLERGRLNKARRGELFSHPPVGYFVLPNGEFVKEPDAQGRSAVELLFEKFEELGSAYAVFRWFCEHQIKLPFRPRNGPLKGEIDWRQPCSSSIHQTLHNPMYAGTYVFGRRREDAKLGSSAGNRPRKKWLPIDEWEVVIHDHLPAYISWEQFLENIERLHDNRSLPTTPGVPRQGAALLSGIVECSRCGWRMHATYQKQRYPVYACQSGVKRRDLEHHGHISATLIDELVVRQALLALEPAALQISLRAQSDSQRERERLHQHWRQQRERAQYDVDLAVRRYRAVDPDNRLVAATLEQQWEAALREQSRIEEEYHRFSQQTPAGLRPQDEEQILELARTVPALWNAPGTTNADRQAIIRCVIDKVVIDFDQSERGQIMIHWKGGFENRVNFVRRVRVYQQLQDFDRLQARVVELRDAGISCEAAADILNAEGFQTCQPGLAFNKHSARGLMLKINAVEERQRPELLGPDERFCGDLARELGIPLGQLRYWAHRGWVHGRQTPVRKYWILWVDADERRRLEQLRDSRTHGMHGYPAELITPKRRPSTT
ncbi:MAG: recombinase family protein [Planctomycetaceae bacterium]